MTQEQAIAIAYRHLNRRFRVLASASEARVTFPEFNPHRAVQPIAIIEWPCIANCRPTTCFHVINDGDPIN